MKATCDKADPRGTMPVPNVVVVPEELSLADIALLLAKERNKILSQKARDAKKVERASAKATAVAEKEAKKDERAGKSKVMPSQTKTSSCKRNSTFAELAVSRLHLCASPSFQNGEEGTLLLDELSSLHLWMPLHLLIWSTMPS